LERLVKFEVLGQEYPLYTDAPEEELEEILYLVKSQIEDQSKSSKSLLPANKIAILTSLNMAGKYVRLKRDFEIYKDTVDQSLERIITKIAHTLSPESNPDGSDLG